MVMKSSSNILGQLRGFANDARAELFSFIPTSVGDHLAIAKKEVLTAVREVIDEEIRWTDKRWDAAKERKEARKASRPAPSDGSPKSSAATA